MGKAMHKSKVIWGERRSVTLASFSEVHFKQVFQLIRENIGPNEYVNEAGIRRAIMLAKQNPKLKNGYVKLGLIGSDLVIRAKEKKFLGDIEIDAVAVKSYPTKVNKYEPIKRELERQQMQKDLDDLEKRKKGREQLKTARQGSGVTPVSQLTTSGSRVKPPLPTGPKPVLKPRPELTRQSSKGKEEEQPPLRPQLTRQPSKGKEEAQVKPPSGPKKEEIEQQEREVEETRLELERLGKEAEELRKSRLRNVMNRTDDEGVSLRDRLLRAAKKAQMLGIGDYAQQKLKAQGLTPMQVDYHGEVLDHQKNRYGRYLKPLWDIFQKADPKMSFSRWLDAVEADMRGVAGVDEARHLTSREIGVEGGRVVQSGGTAGGLMIYLDDETRKPYAATVSKGNVTGGQLDGSGQILFVIGPDNKVYIGRKGRASAGVRGAFNHSSFFSGGPVRSAGSLKMSGSRITEVSDESGHYAPTTTMVQTAVRKFAGGDKGWLANVTVKVGGLTQSGTDFMEAEAKTRQESTWGKYSAGNLTTSRAAKLLEGQEDGSWLVWQNGTRGLYLSHNKGGGVTHVPIVEIGAQALERKKLLTPDKLSTISTATPSGEKENTENESTKTTATDPQQLEDLKNHPAWHAGLTTERAAALLRGHPDGAFLVRPSSTGVVAASYVYEGKVVHARLNERTNYENFMELARRNRTKMVRPGQAPPRQAPPRQAQPPAFGPVQVNEMMQSAAWHARLKTEQAEALLGTMPENSWLLRPSSQGGVAMSWVEGTQVAHRRVTTATAYQAYLDHARAHARRAVRP